MLGSTYHSENMRFSTSEAGLVALAYATIFLGYGLYAPYFPIYLNDLGLTASEIGVLMGAPLLVRLFSGYVMGVVADLSGNRALSLFVFAICASVLLTAMAVTQSFWLLLGLVLICAIFWTAIVPVLDAIALDVCRRRRAKWGHIRVGGSLSFVAANLGGGFYLGWIGAASLPVLVAGCVLATGFIGVWMHLVFPAHVHTDNKAATPRAEGRRWLTPYFVAGLLAIALVEGSHAVFYARGSLHWQELGFSESYIGILWAVSVTGEVLLFLMAHRLPKRMNAEWLIGAAAVVAVVRWGVFPLVTDPFVSLVLQLSHGITFGAAYLGLMAWINAHVPSAWLASAQGLAATMMSVVMALLMLSTGPVVDTFGIYVLWLAAVSAGVGGLLIVLLGLIQPNPHVQKS